MGLGFPVGFCLFWVLLVCRCLGFWFGVVRSFGFDLFKVEAKVDDYDGLPLSEILGSSGFMVIWVWGSGCRRIVEFKLRGWV